MISRRRIAWLGSTGAVLLTGVASAGLLSAGCTGDDSSAMTSTGGSTGNAGAAGAGGGGTAGGAGGTAGGDTDGATSTLYSRLGGHMGIRMALDAVVGEELKDPEIAGYFSAQTAATTPAGHPNADQVEECLTNQLGAAAGGAETYPVKLGADHGGWQCRDMATIHQSMGISSGTFDKFVMIAATKLTSLGVSSADVATIGSVLNSTKPQIVSGGSDAGHD